ncbi:MAG TPA: acyltransferase family protein [Telluria sp.]|nr:acyltransferase family protein [Telluria sp.]
MDKPQRHYFLDWARIIAFFILILYHTGMYYVTWDWHVKSPFASGMLEPFMFLSSPWRLGLLFFISGVASAFLLSNTRAGAFVRQRSWRLLLPLAFGMLVIVPLQPYYEVVEKVGYTGSFLEFMRLYVTGFDGFCREDCLILPTWNHLWFVAYLWVYTVLLAALATLSGSARLERWGSALARLLGGWRAIVLPAAVLAASRNMLAYRFETTHALVDDFYSHGVYLPLFAAGVLLAREERFWKTLQALRVQALGIALACWAFLVYYHLVVDHSAHSAALMEVLRPTEDVVYGLCQWSAIAAACGFARRHLNQDGPRRQYLTHAVFPVYILHQTVIVTLAHNMQPLGLAPAIEGPVIVALTLALCFGGYEVMRRFALTRPLFGLGEAAAPASAPRTAPATPAY